MAKFRGGSPGQKTEREIVPLEDESARVAALDTSRSFLVQAPAGSGKTELLTRRLLKLLAEVDEPEQVLAITFTRAATAEMRMRVLHALGQAKNSVPSDQPDPLVAIAAAVLKNDGARGWRLLEQPQRLNIQTIDSLCLNIAHQTPLLSRLGGSLTPTEHAEPLYALAARRTLARFGGERKDLSTAIRTLLELRDTSLRDCEQLIAGMLERRDQWGHVLGLMQISRWQEVRTFLESPFVRERTRVIAKARALLGRDAAVADELLELLTYARRNLEQESDNTRLLALKDVTRLEQLEEPSHWDAVCDFLLASGRQWRKQLNSRVGFPRDGQREKLRYKAMISALDSVPGSLEVLCALPKLPPPQYSTEQWELLQHILLILYHAAAELRVIFAEQSVVDFVELGLAAREALRGDHESSQGIGLPPVQHWRHLLVDEFQDTSRGQYELLTLLVEQWDSSEHCTCFLVGDPMQSIYGFREAEVELFERTRRYGLGSSLSLEFLELKTNFRSHAGLVSPLNQFFTAIFAAPSIVDRYQVTFAASVASRPAPRGPESLHVKAQFQTLNVQPEEVLSLEKTEADQAVHAIEKAIAEHRDEKDFRIAVLVRARRHLVSIAQKLREQAIPYRAVEIEELRERQEVLDLRELVRALLHPMDRIAWVSVLRAPWCGLTLRDLHILCGQDAAELTKQPVLQLLRMRLPLLSADGQQRASRISIVLENALGGKHRQVSFAQWVERVWYSLGGRECVDRAAYENVRAFFRMLAEVPPDGTGLDQQLEQLFAEPDPKTNEQSGVQLMTIHKAKGLGFDVVIVPGLHRETSSRDQPLLNWLERTTIDGAADTEGSEFLVAPIGRKGADTDPLYRWISRQQERKEREEAKRLLYVACTRAKQGLYLMGTATLKTQSNGTESVEPGKGLLKTAWPALKKIFETQREEEISSIPIQSLLPFPVPGASPNPPGANAVRASRKTIPLRRLPADWQPWFEEPLHQSAGESKIAIAQAEQTPGSTATHFERATGSLKVRALGIVVHALLEELTNRLLSRTADELAAELQSWRARAIALLRQAGLSFQDAQSQSAKVIEALRSTLEDEAGRWILTARTEAETETSWSAWSESERVAAVLRTLRGDRVFRAGPEPHSRQESHLWIVDYKTAQHGAQGLESFLAEEKERYRRQLETYAEVMRHVRGEELPLRLALYYPLLKKLLWWEAGSP